MKKLNLEKIRGNTYGYFITKESELIKSTYYCVNFPPSATVKIPQFPFCCCKLTFTNYVIYHLKIFRNFQEVVLNFRSFLGLENDNSTTNLGKEKDIQFIGTVRSAPLIAHIYSSLDSIIYKGFIASCKKP